MSLEQNVDESMARQAAEYRMRHGLVSLFAAVVAATAGMVVYTVLLSFVLALKNKSSHPNKTKIHKL